MLPSDLIEVRRNVFVSALEGAQRQYSLIRVNTTPAIVLPRDALFYLTGDALSGFAVQFDGTLVGLFNMSSETRGHALVDLAISLGARKLDCFDNGLPRLYARHGFVETHRVPNWHTGGPDVVFMALSVPAQTDTV